MELQFTSAAVVVVAGVPGAGKSTLIRRAAPPGARVVDTDDARARGRGGRGLYLRHYARIACAVVGRRPVVIHTRGTRPAPRRAIRVLAALVGRPAHLVLVDAPREVAEAGQRERGRTVSRATMDAEWRRWQRLLVRGVGIERWRSLDLLTREDAAQVTAFAFGAAPRGAAPHSRWRERVTTDETPGERAFRRPSFQARVTTSRRGRDDFAQWASARRIGR